MFFSVFLISLLEGLTEFLPVSSTGHMILLEDILHFESPPGKVFEVVIQLGAILAICVLYRMKLLTVVHGMTRKRPADWRFAANLLIAFAPAMVMGALFHQFIKDVLFNARYVSIAFILGGIAIILIEKIKPQPKYHTLDDLSFATSLKIGLFQCLALIPGTSRSGATIMGSLLLGVERKAAAEFSFFLAIPTMVAASAFDLFKNWHALTADNLQWIAVGFVVAFVSALLVVRWFIGYVTKHGFVPFAWYRIVVGAVALLMLS